MSTDSPTETGDRVTLRPGLSRRQRRELGLTARNVRNVLVALHATNNLHDRTAEEVAIDVVDVLAGQNAAAFVAAADADDFDWNAFFEWVERIIELLMKILPLFI